ncbi:polysaccharide deacetylase family protein [Lederbergia sp. NSJ-179]|uniref:polysaccharide deacetylase family protein n=1 Tax=Lederbergia sp. NSJ-179 TaxID=2931402 RepID=UPI001FD2205E|nr:polysaccharide deacetylase family protein [Lederbergia sp. NSJ-179]MCJ7841136.1 polysaccharide deacetylase family protein [Lederbergia sp. NSJ-179]
MRKLRLLIPLACLVILFFACQSKHNQVEPIITGQHLKSKPDETSKTHKDSTGDQKKEIKKSQANDLPASPDKEKTIYLTFDDGPSSATNDILDTLDQFDAEATFFMLEPAMKELPEAVNKIAEEGQAMGLHGVTHDKNQFYKSEENALEEMVTTQETLQQITGIKSNLIRTPYGSVPYLTETYREVLDNHGFKVWDWTVDSDDWSLPGDQYVNRAIKQIEAQVDAKVTPIVLMHDKQNTANHLSMRFKDYSSYLTMEEEPIPDEASFIQSKGLGIMADQLIFRYPANNHDTLKNINFTIKPGSSVAFVGENGSGKTTLVKMILGLYRPTSGTIKWCNENGEVQIHNVANESRVIFQDFIKLLRPVRENVAIGDISMINNDAALLRALKKADADSFSEGLDTFLGPEFGGVDLSGGQWQRLAIGRAYLKKSSLTIFDEPTASLDPNSEKKAFDIFVNLGDQQTSIIVTHRLYITKFVDEIFMFENGEIVESGSHKELINAKGKYEKMFRQQSTLYAPRKEEV